ncbi:hypothetical protein TWF281_007857 [Arthrobotrys megalospora]
MSKVEFIKETNQRALKSLESSKTQVKICRIEPAEPGDETTTERSTGGTDDVGWMVSVIRDERDLGTDPESAI